MILKIFRVVQQPHRIKLIASSGLLSIKAGASFSYFE
jgi:hypothetical protein